MKVYAVYSIPKSPEYRLEKLFKTKELAKAFIEEQKSITTVCENCLVNIRKYSHYSQFDDHFEECDCSCHNPSYAKQETIYDLQIEEVVE